MSTDLRTLRERTGESMVSVALRAGIEPALLSLVERGKRPSKQTADRIAAALGADPRAIWGKDYARLRTW